HDKRRRKKCDWIAANDVSGDIMGGADNQIMLITDAGAEAWARMSKRDVAAKLSQRIGHYFSSKKEV
ncbi:MAG: bifunctional phosphopantothenoylcysteine decarboxylase/phosphopantothenate synthase, partial [Henriciella sp.]